MYVECWDLKHGNDGVTTDYKTVISAYIYMYIYYTVKDHTV